MPICSSFSFSSSMEHSHACFILKQVESTVSLLPCILSYSLKIISPLLSSASLIVSITKAGSSTLKKIVHLQCRSLDIRGY